MTKDYHDYTREERKELILTDPKTYIDLLTSEHWYELLGKIAKTGGIEVTEEMLTEED